MGITSTIHRVRDNSDNNNITLGFNIVCLSVLTRPLTKSIFLETQNKRGTVGYYHKLNTMAYRLAADYSPMKTGKAAEQLQKSPNFTAEVKWIEVAVVCSNIWRVIIHSPLMRYSSFICSGRPRECFSRCSFH